MMSMGCSLLLAYKYQQALSHKETTLPFKKNQTTDLGVWKRRERELVEGAKPVAAVSSPHPRLQIPEPAAPVQIQVERIKGALYVCVIFTYAGRGKAGLGPPFAEPGPLPGGWRGTGEKSGPRLQLGDTRWSFRTVTPGGGSSSDNAGRAGPPLPVPHTRHSLPAA